MAKGKKGLTRRDFLMGTAGATVAGALGLLSRPWPVPETQASPEQSGKSKVVLIRDREVLDDKGRLREAVLERMIDEGIAALLGEKDARAAWEKIVSPDDVVGVKSNAWRFLPTPPELEEILRRRLLEAGVNKENLAIDDRGVLRNPVFTRSTALINVRPMRTHHWAGVGSCLKNYIMFSPYPPRWHGDSCADLAGLWELPLTRGKTRLNILVMLTPLFHGKGPHHFQARYTWAYRGFLIGTDPVAVDATGLRIIEAKRRLFFGDDEPLVVSPKHIRVAAEKYHLGVADPQRIELKKLGWMEEALI